MSKLDSSLHQRREKVKAFFHASSSFWRDIYTVDNLYAKIHQERHKAMLDWIVNLALEPGSQVLEVGCGAGFMSIALAQHGLCVHAIDPVESMVELARQHAVEAEVAEQLSLQLGDVYDLHFKDESFDLVIALGVIPWLERPELAIKEMARVIRPGGYVALTADNRFGLNLLLDPWLNLALAPLRRRVKDVLARFGLHFNSQDEAGAICNTFHDPRLIDAMLASAQLIKTRSTTLGFGPFSLWRRELLREAAASKLHQWLQHLADRNVPCLRSTGEHYLVLATKQASGPLDEFERRSLMPRQALQVSKKMEGHR